MNTVKIIFELADGIGMAHLYRTKSSLMKESEKVRQVFYRELFIHPHVRTFCTVKIRKETLLTYTTQVSKRGFSAEPFCQR